MRWRSCPRPLRVMGVLALLAALAVAAVATASRRPTGAETRAIRSAAVRTLHGSGWQVSGIRVSTVRTRYRYAKAAVDNRRTGVGGDMILRKRYGRWARIFLGTDGFCTVHAPRGVLRDLGFGCR